MLSRALMSCLGSTAAAGSSTQLLAPASMAMAGRMRCMSDKTDTSMTEKVKEKVGE
jgi:hypothetical protein